MLSLGASDLFHKQILIKVKSLKKQSLKESCHYINEYILCLKISNITAETRFLHDYPQTHFWPSFPGDLLFLISVCPSRLFSLPSYKHIYDQKTFGIVQCLFFKDSWYHAVCILWYVWYINVYWWMLAFFSLAHEHETVLQQTSLPNLCAHMQTFFFLGLGFECLLYNSSLLCY